MAKKEKSNTFLIIAVIAIVVIAVIFYFRAGTGAGRAIGGGLLTPGQIESLNSIPKLQKTVKALESKLTTDEAKLANHESRITALETEAPAGGTLAGDVCCTGESGLEGIECRKVSIAQCYATGCTIGPC